MKYKFIVFLLFLSFNTVFSQELNCVVTVNANQVGATNNQIFKTLQRSLTDFVNKTNWTNKKVTPNERINCSMFINVTEQQNDQFSATIQVQSNRTIFNSTYSSPVFNFNDKEFNFQYTEFQVLNFNPNSFDSNLVSVISYYSLMIIGLDGDTYSLNGGDAALAQAQEVVNVAQSSGYEGWSQSKGNSNRYFLISDMLSNTYAPYRNAMYQFHLSGLDLMTSDIKSAKENIKKSIATLKEINKSRPNSFLMRVFFDAKTDELVSIFSGGPSTSIADLVDNLNNMSPLNSSKWSNIKL